MSREKGREESDGVESPKETLGAATRALVDAATAMTRLIGRQIEDDVSTSVTRGLREASSELSEVARALQRASTRVDSRAARADRTRADLLSAAERLIAERGYEAASVADIAAAAGYTKGALYAHFASKEALFLELAGTRRAAAEPRDRTAADPVDLIEEARAAASADVDDPALLFGLESFAYAVRHPDARDVLLPPLARAFEDLALQVRDARRRRDDADAVDPADSPPTREDRDLAFVLGGLPMMAALQAAVGLPEDDTVGAVERIITRLLA